MADTVYTDLISFREGDEKAFERLYKFYWSKVFHFTSLYITDDYEREEIVQQVFIRLWNMRSRILPEHGIDGLLFIITRNMVFNCKHRSFNKKALQEALAMDRASGEDLEQALSASDLELYLMSLVDMLPTRQREAFLLSRREGLSYREIASKMGISENGVKRNIHLALKFLKHNLPFFLMFLS